MTMNDEDELSIESLNIGSDGVSNQQQMPHHRKTFDNLNRRPRAGSAAGAALSEMGGSSRVSSPASQASSGITGRTHNSSSPSFSTSRSFGTNRRQATINGISHSPTFSDSSRHSPALSSSRKTPQYNASTIASTLSRYRHSRNASVSSSFSDPKRPDSAASNSSRQNTFNETLSQPSTSRPASRQQFQLRARNYTRAGTSVYSSRVPTQILINNLIGQLEKELDAYESTPDKWAQFKTIKSALSELESAQSDSHFPPAEATAPQFRRRFDNMVIWLEGAHSQRLEKDAAEKERRVQSEEADPFHHLTGDFRRLALQGAQPFLLPPHTYPTELPLLHVEPVHSVERGWGLQLNDDVKFNTPVLQIPNHLIMSSSSAVFHPKVAEVISGREVFFQFNALIRLTLQLIVEVLDGYLSPFQSYIATLPPTPWSPLAYTTELLEPYRKALTTTEIIEHTRHATRLYHSIYKNLSLTTFLNRNTFTWSAFQWAYSTVLSRAIALPFPTPSLLGANSQGGVQEYGLVPMIDLANFSHTGPMPLYNPSTACLEIIAPTTLSAGSELVIRWPMLSNRELLLRYGICADTMLANDALRLTVSLPPINRDTESWDRYVLCQSIRLPSSNTYPLHRPPVTRSSRELLQYILVIALDLPTLRQAISQAEPRPAPGRPFLRDRIQALRFLDSILGELPTDDGIPAQITPALQTALSWLRVTLQVHLRLALKVGDLDSSIRSLDPNSPASYPSRWFLQALRHELRFVRSSIDEFDILLGGKSILDD